MLLSDYLKKVEEFIKNYLNDNGGKCYILGVSGGVDSSLLAALTREAVGKDKLLCLIIPIESNSDKLPSLVRTSLISNLKSGLYSFFKNKDS